jgi:hypothetical protein
MESQQEFNQNYLTETKKLKLAFAENKKSQKFLKNLKKFPFFSNNKDDVKNKNFLFKQISHEGSSNTKTMFQTPLSEFNSKFIQNQNFSTNFKSDSKPQLSPANNFGGSLSTHQKSIDIKNANILDTLRSDNLDFKSTDDKLKLLLCLLKTLCMNQFFQSDKSSDKSKFPINCINKIEKIRKKYSKEIGNLEQNFTKLTFLFKQHPSMIPFTKEFFENKLNQEFNASNLFKSFSEEALKKNPSCVSINLECLKNAPLEDKQTHLTKRNYEMFEEEPNNKSIEMKFHLNDESRKNIDNIFQPKIKNIGVF